MSRFRLLSALLAALLIPACGGGGGGGGGGPTQPPPPAPVSFTTTGGGSNNLALAQGSATTATTLALELRASQVSDLYGVAFDLSYPTAQLSYSSAGEGIFLSQGGVSTTLQVLEASPGRLVVGLSRLGPVAGADGSGVLLRLEFAVGANGSGDLSFSENQAFAADGTALGSITWSGGTVRVNR